MILTIFCKILFTIFFPPGIANLNNAMHNYSNIYSTTRGHMSAQHRVLARSRGRYGLQVPPSMNQMMPSTSDSSPTYGRYYRGTVVSTSC